jgi:hypothetical protein
VKRFVQLVTGRTERRTGSEADLERRGCDWNSIFNGSIKKTGVGTCSMVVRLAMNEKRNERGKVM